VKPRTILLLVALLAVGLALAGVSQAAPNDPDVTEFAHWSDPQDAISPAPFAPVTAAGRQSGATPTPHPILSDVRVRQAIAYCTDKAVMLASVYPSLTPAQRQALIADTFIRPSSWAYTTPATTYPFAPATGQALLDQADWTLEPGATYRMRDGKQLVLTLRTTDSPFRITFLTVFETQMQACGIRVIREHLDMNWFFGKHTGIQVRDFELSDFAWMIPDSEPAGQTIYACDQIPTPVNGWQGENFPGWCNASASTAITTATNTALGQTERKAAYAVVINAAATDLPQLPLFWRDDGTGHPSETWEHIDFNLETYSQDAELAPTTATTLNTTDYAGNAGSVEVPAGAVAQNTTLSYYPLVASAYAAPQGKTLVRPFRLTAALQGVPQAAFAFNTPVILTVRYDDASLSSIWDEAALNLYRWVEGTGWQPAQESCPEGQRNYQVDRATNTVVVHICHLSEFALIGDTKHIVYLPLVLKNYPLPLRINLGSYPDSMDPQKDSYVNELSGLRLIYEGLTGLDENLQTVPGAAESWVYNAGATELTFTLRAGLQYSDGTPLNAKRFAYSILRSIDPTTNGDYAAITDEIVGASAYRNADVAHLTPAQLQQLRDAVEVRALDGGGQACTSYAQTDCRTLKLKFERTAPYFHTVMSLQVTFPAKEELIAAGGTEWWRSPQYQIGNGKFVMKVNTAGSVTSFVPNPRYGRGRATYSIEYRYIADSAAAFDAYRADQLDIIALAAADRGTVEADPVLKQQLLTYPGSCTFALMFHNQKPPFTDHKVREAFAYAIDREAWVRDNGGSPTLTWIPKGYPGYDATETRWGYNPGLAQQALAASSYGSAANLPPVTATFIDTPRNRARWTWLIDQFRTVLGVQVAFNPVSSSTPQQMYLQGWCADYPDPQNWLSTYWQTRSTFAARIGYSNLAVDAVLDQADAEPNQATRMALYAQAQQMITTDLPVAYMYNNLNAYLVKPRVQGVKTTPQDSDWAGSMVPLSITLR